RIRMPMHLAHSAWLYLNQRSRDRLRSRKHRGIGDAHGATAAADGFLREHPMTQRVTHWTRADDSISGERSGNFRLKDPEILLRTGRQLSDRRLPAPAARRQMHMTIGKRPSQVSERAVVGRGRQDDVAVLGFA